MRHSRLALAIRLTTVIVNLTECAYVQFPSYSALNLSAPALRPGGTVPAVRQFSTSQFLSESPIVCRESSECLGSYERDHSALDPRCAPRGRAPTHETPSIIEKAKEYPHA
jgi:hypothetical protein